ncbi:hypothetical protein [Rhodococcus sp. 114MFTsu3.1]|uniref:hypothetical protein n=1 Tax=Rhodococcus sp. 114MFTsu3.1 TaxID=1172184 RepID=UPI000399DA54|nr:MULTISPECIES: hypothetical protein [unclassified Rhodococcus (in: high G+C Gram-positive bacteria)]
MRSLVLLLSLTGAVVGLLPAVLEFVQQAYFASEVEYNGVYEPLRGVQTSRAYETSQDISFQVRSGLFLRRAVWFAPLMGAALGAVAGIIAYRFGFRLTRGA